MSSRLQPCSTVIDTLRQLVGERLSTSLAEREQRGRDESYNAPALPEAEAFARSTEVVAAIIEVCARHHNPFATFGISTLLEGHVQAPHGEVCMDLAGMNVEHR